MDASKRGFTPISRHKSDFSIPCIVVLNLKLVSTSEKVEYFVFQFVKFSSDKFFIAATVFTSTSGPKK